MHYWVKWVFVVSQILYIPSECSVVKPVYHELSREIFSAPPGLSDEAMFGYSIAYQSSTKRLIVGSPMANNFGQVFSCDVKSNLCTKIPVHIDSAPAENDTFWFGATVKALDSHIVSCAPRNRRGNGIYGSCYFDQSPGRFSKMYLTARMIQDNSKYYYGDKNGIIHEHLMTTFGWSMDVPEDNTILIGGPGMTTGRVVKYKINGSSHTPEILSFQKGTVMYNFGYSIASGYFFTKNEKTHAISSPYGEIGKGKILFFSEKYKFTRVLLDDDVGTIFGASLCFASLGEQRQILLVGAPAFAPTEAFSASSGASKSKIAYDVGAVHIYKYNKEIHRTKTIVGQQNGGYFGSAIVSVGDLNNDQIDEVAISAPYEDEGQGAVYIYSGADLLKEQTTWLQRIKTEGKPYRGLSVAVLQDSDENGCNELAIGMPGANKVMLVRCLASVTTNLQLNLPVSPITDRKLNYFQFEPCLNVIYPEKPKTVNSNILISIQIIHPNATFESADKGTIKFEAHLVERKDKYCNKVKVLLPEDGDYDRPIVFKMTAQLSVDPLTNKKFDPTLVTLSEHSQVSLQSEVKAPGSELSLTINSTMQNGYQIGSTPSELVTLVVRSAVGVAYDCCVRVRLDGGGATVMRRPATCSSDDSSGSLICTPPGPLHTRTNWTGIIKLDTSTMTSNSETVEVTVELLTRCSDLIGTTFKKIITLKSDPSVISVKGLSNPGFFMNLTRTNLNFETQIEHVYSIMNRGFSTWEKIKITITVPPYKYIQSQVTSASATCDKIDEKLTCNIKEIKGNDKVDINVGIIILPDSPITDQILSGVNASIVTQIDVLLENETKTKNITTVISLREPSVEWWIIALASVIGLLLLLIIAWALYECGFLRRKNKEQLDVLKTSIKRQTMMRQSMKLRQSLIEAVAKQHREQEDSHMLLDASEETSPEDRRVRIEDRRVRIDDDCGEGGWDVNRR